MRALVTGGHGFIGRHLVRRLRERGDEVRILYRRAGLPESLAAWDVEVARGDLRDSASIAAAVRDIDAVFHLGGLTRARTRAEMFDVNAGGTARLLAAARDGGRVDRFVYCSSTAARGPSPCPTPVPDADLPPALSWYGASKAHAEGLIARHAGPLPWVTVRPTAVYGPGDRDFLTLFRAVERGLALLPGGRGSVYSLVHADDVVEALLAVTDMPQARGRTYTVAHPELLTMEAIIEAAEAAVGRRARRLPVPASVLRLVGSVADLGTQLTGRASLLGSQRVVEVAARHWVCSADALAADTAWRPVHDVRSGFAQTVEAYRREGQLAARQPGLPSRR
ncbi:MAG: NAD-dependent epimerase/dehydratase family protein [Planctomycetota bacterium]